MRIVIELKKDANALVTLNNLYKHTQLQQSFSFNMIALDNGQPKLLNLKDILRLYLKHQVEVVLRRTQYDLDKSKKRQHLLLGLSKVLEDIDNAITLIKKSKTSEEAKGKLKQEYSLDDVQAKAILETRLQKLTGLEIEKINKELTDLSNKIKHYNEIIESDVIKKEIIKEELESLELPLSIWDFNKEIKLQAMWEDETDNIDIELDDNNEVIIQEVDETKLSKELQDLIKEKKSLLGDKYEELHRKVIVDYSRDKGVTVSEPNKVLSINKELKKNRAI